MDIKVYPGKLNGQIGAIPSKSAAHRAILAAALSDKPTRLLVSRPSISQDIAATINCVKALGGEILANNGEITVKPITKVQNRTVLDCGESGTTLRFILPIAAALSDNFSVTGRGRLADRPLEDLCMALESHGCICSSHSIPLGVSGHLHAGEFVLPGKISSQYVSGLLLAAAVLDTKSQITLSTPLESAGYVELTRDVMHSFGIETGKESNSYSVETLGYHSPGTYPIEGDWSNAAFWLVAQKMGSSIKITGLNDLSAQPDRVIESLISKLGNGTNIDVANCPDLMPILAVLATYAPGETHFINAARLRLKESDRISAVAQGLTDLGIAVAEQPDGLTVHSGTIQGGDVDGYNDHRLVMSWAIASLVAQKPIVIHGAEAVAKSYPDFWQDYQQLGGNFDVL